MTQAHLDDAGGALHDRFPRQRAAGRRWFSFGRVGVIRGGDVCSFHACVRPKPKQAESRHSGPRGFSKVQPFANKTEEAGSAGTPVQQTSQRHIMSYNREQVGNGKANERNDQESM